MRELTTFDIAVLVLMFGVVCYLLKIILSIFIDNKDQ